VAQVASQVEDATESARIGGFIESARIAAGKAAAMPQVGGVHSEWFRGLRPAEETAEAAEIDAANLAQACAAALTKAGLNELSKLGAQQSGRNSRG
jgi:hypothetical protein